MFQRIELFITAAVRISNPTQIINMARVRNFEVMYEH
jgi:hypothetical protein